jgi:hypothetical protein
MRNLKSTICVVVLLGVAILHSAALAKQLKQITVT